ncbi:ABC transporter substrate-binding protein [Nocardioides ginsengisoli]|uniref:ABC transporter substrate-binding protein n=1 Tax=Nocardioides ginsengisoli TaxID=363868 RepID=A0ABW3W599_9ACTN
MKTIRTTLAAATAVAASLLITACAAPDEGSTGGGAPDASTSVKAQGLDAHAAGLLPAAIKQAGVVKVASGVSFPPMEYFDTDNKTVLGFDADLGKALGEVLGVKFDFQNTNFDGIIGGLTAHRYDLGLTSMIDKPERQTQVDFVDYLNSGVSFLVVKGNPDGLTQQSDLCGRKVAVEKASTGDLVADDISKDCQAAGKKPVDKSPLPDQASAIQALQSGRADAVLALDLTLAYNVKQNPDSFEVPAKPFGTLPVGIAVPKDSTGLRDAVAAALKVLQDNGTYSDLLAKWNLTDQALTGAPINSGK